jgi:hypothetical protein
VSALLDRVDLNPVLDRVDVDRLLGRVDVAGLAARSDLNQLVAGADVNQIVQRVDVDEVVREVDWKPWWTAGMGLFGGQVVRDDSTGASARRAVVRTLAPAELPVFWAWGSQASCWATGAGHCTTSSPETAVIYSSDARAARLRFLSRG